MIIIGCACPGEILADCRTYVPRAGMNTDRWVRKYASAALRKNADERMPGCRWIRARAVELGTNDDVSARLRLLFGFYALVPEQLVGLDDQSDAQEVHASQELIVLPDV